MNIQEDRKSMIKSIRLKNFKCYRDSGQISCAPLTILVGCNNAGKSSILQSMLVLSQTLRDPSSRARLVTKGDFVDLGGYFDILHGKGQSKFKKLSIEIEREPYECNQANSDEFRESTRLALTLSFDKIENRVQVHKLVLSDRDGPILSCNEKGDWSATGVTATTKKYLNCGLRHFLPSMGFDEGMLKKLKGGKALRLMSSALSCDRQAHPWIQLLYDLSRVPPHRSHVPFYAGLGERVRSEGGLSGANLVQALGSTQKLPATGKSLLDSIGENMEEYGAISNVKLEELDEEGHIRSLMADDPQGGERVNVAAMGEGISQMLPVVAATLRSDEHSILLVEQPEIHLHPALQSKLADLFVQVVNYGKRQIIVETHSEHLLLRLRTHVAKGNIEPEKVSILYVEKKGGASTVRRLKLNGKGHFDDWPKGFFDEAYKEAMDLAMASAEK